MEILRTVINDRKIWLVIDQLIVYSKDFSSITTVDKYLCYFNLEEPEKVYGELLKDENGIPLLFKSVYEAKSYAEKHLKGIL